MGEITLYEQELEIRRGIEETLEERWQLDKEDSANKCSGVSPCATLAMVFYPADKKTESQTARNTCFIP